MVCFSIDIMEIQPISFQEQKSYVMHTRQQCSGATADMKNNDCMF